MPLWGPSFSSEHNAGHGSGSLIHVLCLQLFDDAELLKRPLPLNLLNDSFQEMCNRLKNEHLLQKLYKPDM
ncbi:hypothetical protein U1Q18_045242, partial [Sarracenia purpurea var. burkii]